MADTLPQSSRAKVAQAREHVGAVVRTPFVDLFIGGQRINLQGGRQFSGQDIQKAMREAPVASPAPLFLSDFRYEITNGVRVGQEVGITIIDPNWDYLENLIATNIQARDSINFNFGWRGIDDKHDGNITTGFVLKNYTVSYVPFQGAKVSLVGLDRSVILSYARLQKAFPPTTRLDSVLKQVIEASDPRLEAKIETMEQVIGEEHNRMHNQTAMEYISHLLMIAKGKGRLQDGVPTNSDFVMRTEPGEAGKTRVVISSDTPRRTVVENYVVGRERQGEMLEFTPQLLGSVVLSLGGGKQVGASVDPESKNVRKVTSTHLEDQPRVGDVTVHPVPEQPTQFHELPFTALADVEGFTKGARAAIDKNQFPATAVVRGDTRLKPLDQINVIVLKSNSPGVVDRVTDRSIVHVSGVYRIDTVEHLISAGIFRTNLTLYRESGFVGAGELGIRLAINLDNITEGYQRIKAAVVDITGELF
jgi:hypothetical protein